MTPNVPGRIGIVPSLRYLSAVLVTAAVVAVLGGLALTTTIDGLLDALVIGLSFGVAAGIVFVFSLWIVWRSERQPDEDERAAAP